MNQTMEQAVRVVSQANKYLYTCERCGGEMVKVDCEDDNETYMSLECKQCPNFRTL